MKQVDNIQDLAKLLRCGQKYLEFLVENSYKVVENVGELSEIEIRVNPHLIKTYSINKKNQPREKRNIYYPLSGKLKSTFKILTSWLTTIYKPPKSVHGFVSKRSIKTNADSHLGCRHLLKVDLENFFENISEDQVIDKLIRIGLRKEVATIIASIATLNGVLVQGFSTSPVLSNIVVMDMDNALQNYADKYNYIYTRYADDIVFSSNDERPNFKEIAQIITSFGFKLNSGKTKTRKRGQYQSVTGLTVYDTNMSRIPKKIKRRLRLEVYYIKKYGLKNHCIRRLVKRGKYNNNPNVEKDLKTEIDETRNRIEGWINFSRGIEPEFALKISKTFEERHDL